MARIYSKSFRISFVSLMIGLTLVFELVNRSMPLRVPWGMSIDFVALPILITFFVLGIRDSLVSAFGMFLMLSILGYGSIIGAVMKTASTISMLLVLGLFSRGILRGSPRSIYKSIPKYSIAATVSLLVRCGVAIILNYYWALPLFFQMPVEEIINTFFFGSYIGFISFVSIMNVTQGVVDLVVSWLIVFSVARRLIKEEQPI